MRMCEGWGGNHGDIGWRSPEVVHRGGGAQTGLSTDSIIVQHLYVMGMLVGVGESEIRSDGRWKLVWSIIVC